MGAQPVERTRVRTITSHREAKELAAWLLDEDRTEVVVVVSTPQRSSAPLIDPYAVSRGAGPGVDVVVIATGDLTRAVEDEMPPKTHCFGGAGRAYPRGTRWTKRLDEAPLRFATTPAEGWKVTERLITDATAMAREPVAAARPGVATVRHVTGTVRMVLPPARALVALTDGTVATVRAEDIAPGVPVDRLLSPGMPITGQVSPVTGALSVRESLARVKDALAGYRPGHVVLVKVTRVQPKEALVALMPGVTVRVILAQVTTNPADRLTDLLSVDDVVAARVVRTGRPDGQMWQLSMADVDDDEPIEAAPALLTGGPAWLHPDDVADVATDELDDERIEEAPLPERTLIEPSAPSAATPASAGPLPGPAGDAAVRAELDRLRQELAEATRKIRELRDDRHALVEEADSLAAENAELRHTAAGLRTHLRRTRGPAKTARQHDEPEQTAAFADPADQLRHEIYLEWARRIPAGEKADRPLRPFDIGEDFLTSVAATEGVDRSKVVAVIVEVLTGLADTMPGREMHRLREGTAGNSAAVEDDELGTAWRVSLQTKTASARRLHLWRRSDGHVTLAKIGLHDDMSI